MPPSPDPNTTLAHYHRALSLERMGRLKEAIAHYDQAIAASTQPDAMLWVGRGNALRSLGRYREALRSFERALSVEPEQLQALSGKATLLAVLGRQRQAVAVGRQVLAQFPQVAEAWHAMGVVLSVAGRNREALEHFERVLEIQPDFARALYNRGLVLTRLDRQSEAIASLDAALLLSSPPSEAWHANAWAYRGYALMRSGRYAEAIASCQQALDLNPQCYPAALYRLVSVVMSGQLFHHLAQAETRHPLGQNCLAILNVLKYRLGLLLGVLLLLTVGQGTWLEGIRQVLPLLFSLGIIALILTDLWKQRSRFNLIWKAYWTHPLTYVRSLFTVFLTLLTYAYTSSIAPPFFLWGWSNLVFGQPGNIIFQPLNLLKDSATSQSTPPREPAPSPAPPATAWSADPPATDWTASPSPTDWTTSAVPANFPIHIDYVLILILLFWLLLLLGIPFWARLEERIFRRGANTWKQIAVRSTQFGLIHLVAGIPLLGGIVLILPGFLFACRYKYVHDRHLKRTGDTIAAEAAGVEASTADHAVYNAILITLAVAVMLLV